jgi:hypothetical protein
MTNQETIKERYLRDSLPVRLGGIAANLARVKSFSNHDAHREVVESLIDESKFFIEWTARDAELNVLVELVELQRQLARWQLEWTHIWEDVEQRKSVAQRAGIWSMRLLEMSGLTRSPL